MPPGADASGSMVAGHRVPSGPDTINARRRRGGDGAT